MSSLLQTLKELPGTPATATENIYDHVRSELDETGITLFTRAANLDILSPASAADAAVASLDSPARTAAAAALSTLAPQITPYGAAADGGVNIWLAAAEKDEAPVLLQAQIPSSYLASALKNFVSDGPWAIAIVGSDGRVYAKVNGKLSRAPDAGIAGNPTLIDAVADTSQFGWRITAGVPARPVELHIRRNWMAFVAISSLLAVASFTGTTLLARSLLEEENLNKLPQVSGMPSPSDPHEESKRLRVPRKTGEDRIRTALAAGNVGVWQWDSKTGLVHWDAEIARIFASMAENGDQIARKLLRHVDPHDRKRLLKAVRQAVDQGKPLSVEIRIRRPDGETRWIAVRGASSEKGEHGLLSGVAYDVTNQKLSLTRTDALLREVSHRSKNLLALILAMARLTARDAINVKSHLKDFTLRVAGLAASQDLIVASDWQSVDLGTLAAAEIGAVARTDADRILVSGPPFSLTPEAAQTLGMVLTELALNAVQHGALSSATGEVRLSWEFPDENSISICWREIGGPPFPVDSPKGYGMAVVERFSTQGLKLSVRSATDPDGLRWTLTGPIAHIGGRPEKRA
ncbi:MAG: PAS domain-containing protein [Proteobacteria bacterium]|nr:PAS domain-containing protein [Pseudomonadota bacterium]